MSKHVEKTSNFFSEVVGLKLVHLTDNFAELRDYSHPAKLNLMIKKSPSLAHSTYGYSPILNFDIGVNSDLNEIVERAK